MNVWRSDEFTRSEVRRGNSRRCMSTNCLVIAATVGTLLGATGPARAVVLTPSDAFMARVSCPAAQ